jgi:hypothetical protein
VSDDIFQKRLKDLNVILDKYYVDNKKSKDLTWELCLNRMDRRKMITTTEKTDK